MLQEKKDELRVTDRFRERTLAPHRPAQAQGILVYQGCNYSIRDIELQPGKLSQKPRLHVSFVSINESCLALLPICQIVQGLAFIDVLTEPKFKHASLFEFSRKMG